MTTSGVETPPYVMIASGQGEALVQRLRDRLDHSPGDAGARYLLFAALASCGRHAEAQAALDQARLLHGLLTIKAWDGDIERLQRDADYAAAVGLRLYNAGNVAVACIALTAAVQAGCNDPSTLLTHALSLQHQGRADEAVEAFRAVGARFPTPGVTQFLLTAMFAAKDGVRRHAAEARAWAARYAPSRPSPSFANSRAAGRPIRVGYVNPNFTQNQARQFVAPLFDHHDRDRFTVFAFPNQPEDAASWAAPLEIRPIGALADDAAAELIRRERIDILIDCWGHAAGSRLPVFAQRPAPILASWLNYQQTSGIAAIDYVIQTDLVDGDGVDELFVEQVWRMGDACAAFRPDPGPHGSPAPCVAAGRVTFGAFINPAKLSDLTVAMWSRILAARPTARLVLKYAYFVDPVLQAVTQSRFLAHGVNPSQIEFRGRTSGAAYQAEFAEIDLALDPSPCPGGTTSLEALSRGVPVLTLLGDTFYARLGASVVGPAGFPDLLAPSPDAYVAKALELSEESARMQALRERVAPGFDAAPFRDEVGMTRRIEDVYTAMFRRWCETAQAA